MKIGCDGAAMSVAPGSFRGTVIFIDGGYVASAWRPPKSTRRRLRDMDWPTWVAVLSHIRKGVQKAVEEAGE